MQSSARLLSGPRLTPPPVRPPLWIVVVGFSMLWGLLSVAIPTAAKAQARGQTSGSISGRVLVSETDPFENADVFLYGSNSPKPLWQTATDELGYFFFNDLPPGTYSVKAAPPTYVARTLDHIQVTNEPLKPIVFQFDPNTEREPGATGCPTCAVFIFPELPSTQKQLGDPVWNFWVESPPPTSQPTPQIAYTSIYLKPASQAQLVVDLSALAYDGFDKATYSQTSQSAFTKTLRALAGDSITLDLILKPDPLYFAASTLQDSVRRLPVNLKKLRATGTRGVAVFAPPRYMMRVLGEASADYSYGITAFPVRTLYKRGWAPISVEVWNHETSTPLTEATAFVCVVTKDGDDCGPKPPARLTAGTLSGVDLAGRGKPPDAALHISERGNSLVGVFKCNASFCADHEFHAWEIGQGSAWLTDKLTKTLNLLASQEAFSQAHSGQAAQIEAAYMAAGRAIFADLLYSEHQDPGLSPVVSGMRVVVTEGARRSQADTAPPTLFARIMPDSSQLLVIPWALMVMPGNGGKPAETPLGATVEVESPLPLQSYLVPSTCVSNWTLLVPPPRTAGASDALNSVFTARDNVESWITRFSGACSSCNVGIDPSKFGNWLTSNTPVSGSQGIVVLSHHSSDGNTDAYFMDQDAYGNIGPATYANISRVFDDPSFALLDACGTGKPASSEFIHQFNRGGIYSVVSTAVDVDPTLAGKFLDSFMTHLSDGSPDNDHSIGRAKWLATKDLAKHWGSRAYVFSLTGNSAIKACVPPSARATTRH